MLKYIDTHSHIHFAKYDDDRDEVLARMREQGVWTIAIGTTIETSQQAVAFAEKHHDVFAIIGQHPNDSNERYDISYQEKLVEYPSVVGIGECGLDYFRMDVNDVAEKERQRNVFASQIAFAVKHDKPLMLHVRSSEGTNNAHEEVFEILQEAQKEYGEKVRGNLHFFTATTEVAERFLGLGFTIAFPGVITFAKELEDVVRAVPLGMILSETDSPYAAPVPYRGQRNEPAYVVEVVKKIAQIHGKDVDEVAKQLVANAKRVFTLE